MSEDGKKKFWGEKKFLLSNTFNVYNLRVLEHFAT